MKPFFDPNAEESADDPTITQRRREKRWENQSRQLYLRSQAAQLEKSPDSKTNVETSSEAENDTKIKTERTSQKHLPGRHDQRKHGRDQGGGSGGGGSANLGGAGSSGGTSGDEGAAGTATPKRIGKFDPLPGSPKMKNGVRGPDPRLVEVAEEYARQNGIDYKRQAEYVKVDVDRARQIAKAYDEMKDDPKDPKVREAYQDLIDQTLAQYRALENAGYEFWFYDPANNPYPSPYDAMYDLRMNRRMGVFPTRAGFGSDAESSVPLDTESNPLLVDTGVRWSYGSPDGPKQSATANDVFRAVHDAFGHGLEGAGFRDRGEENAWQAHARLFRGPALGALTSETRGQNSWVNFGPYADFNRNASQEDTVYAPQKAGLMPSWTWTLGRANDMEDEVKHVHSWLTIKNHSQQEGMKQAMQIINHFGPGNEQKALIYLQEEMNRVVNVILRSQKNNNISSAKFLKDSEERITTFENAVNIGRYEGMRRYYNTIIDSIRK